MSDTKLLLLAFFACATVIYGQTLDYLKPTDQEQRIEALETSLQNVINGVNKAFADLRSAPESPPEK